MEKFDLKPETNNKRGDFAREVIEFGTNYKYKGRGNTLRETNACALAGSLPGTKKPHFRLGICALPPAVVTNRVRTGNPDIFRFGANMLCSIMLKFFHSYRWFCGTRLENPVNAPKFTMCNNYENFIIVIDLKLVNQTAVTH